MNQRVERFRIQAAAGGYVTVPAIAAHHPLLSALHGHVQDVSTLLEMSLVELMAEIKAVAKQERISVQFCGDLRRGPTVLLRMAETAPSTSVAVPANPLEHLHGDAGHWGLTDFYPEHEQALRETLLSRASFDTQWFSCKKEIHSGRISRAQADAPVAIEVCASMDSALDLVDTAMWEADGKRADSGHAVLETLGMPPDTIRAFIESVADACGLYDDNSSQASRELPANIGFDELVQSMEDLCAGCEADLQARYASVVAHCKTALDIQRRSTAQP